MLEFIANIPFSTMAFIGITIGIVIGCLKVIVEIEQKRKEDAIYKKEIENKNNQ